MRDLSHWKRNLLRRRALLRRALAGLLALQMGLMPLVGQADGSSLPEPENLNARIIGTACFQGRWSAFIEDVNNQSDSFYRVGDPIYGYKIVEIATNGMTLEKASKRYFVPIKAAAVRAVVPETGGRTVAENSYLAAIEEPKVTPNFYVESGKPTQWDYYIPPSEVRTATASGAKSDAAATSAQANRGGRFRFPLSSYKRLSSKFGYRKHPIGGGTKMHNGIDLSAKSGTKISAADAGTVTHSGWRGGYGYCIVIDHHNGYTTTYGHCSKLIADVGDNVRRGEYVANVGSTGASTGPHLHFEVRKDNKPIDPLPFFKGML